MNLVEDQTLEKNEFSWRRNIRKEWMRQKKKCIRKEGMLQKKSVKKNEWGGRRNKKRLNEAEETLEKNEWGRSRKTRMNKAEEEAVAKNEWSRRNTRKEWMKLKKKDEKEWMRQKKIIDRIDTTKKNMCFRYALGTLCLRLYAKLTKPW